MFPDEKYVINIPSPYSFIRWGKLSTNCCTSLTVLKFFYWTERCCYMVFTTEGFFEIAIESRPERNLNPRPLNSFQTLYPIELSYLSSTRTQSKLCTATLISSLSSVFTFHFGHCLRQSPNLSPLSYIIYNIYIYTYIYIYVCIYIYIYIYI